MDAAKEAKGILGGTSKSGAPKGRAEAEALRCSLVAALVGMPKAERAEATKALALHLARHWSGKGDRRAALEVVAAFGRTPEYREVYKSLLTSVAWVEFSRQFSGDIAEILA